MRKKTNKHLLAALILPLMGACAALPSAQYSVAEVLAVPDDTKVVVTGAVIQQLDKEHLLLGDSSGQIRVEADDDILGKVQFAPDAKVRVSGTVDRNSERSVLIAKTVQVVK